MLSRVVAWVRKFRQSQRPRLPREVLLAHRKRALERDLRARGYSVSRAKQAVKALSDQEGADVPA